MKRNLFLLMSLLVGATTVMGQNVRPLEKLTPAVTGKMNVDSSPKMISKKAVNQVLKSVDGNLGVLKSKNVTPLEDVYGYYALPNGSFHSGFTPEIMGFEVPTVTFPAFSEFTLKNYSIEGSTCTWKLGEYNFGEILKDPDQFLKVQGDGSLNVNFPIMTQGYYSWTPTITASKGGKTHTYFYGCEAKKNDVLIGKSAASFGMGFNWLTTADPVYGLYGSISATEYFGKGYMKNGKACTGVLSIFEPMAPLYIKEMGVAMITMEEGQTLMPSDGSLTLTLYKVNSENQITDEVIATSVAKMGTDIVLPAGSTIYFGTFKFMEKDEDGFEQQVGLSMNQPFAAEITGFDKEGYNVRFPLSVNANFMGKSYTVHGDDLSFFSPKDIDDSQTNTQSNVIDILIEMNAAYLTFEMYDPKTSARIPVEGGLGVTVTEDGKDYNDISVYSSLDIKDDDDETPNVWYNKNEIPSWLEVSVDNSLYKDNNIISFFVKGEPLGTEPGRATWVHIYSYGSQISFPVVQGEGVTNISSAQASEVKAVCQGGDFVLTYTNDVKSVDLMNVAGQLVGTYELNASGNYTIPAANLVKGMYVLKFNGAENAVVKIMK